MIYYKTISQNETQQTGQMLIDGQLFEFDKINNGIYKYKVKITNENNGFLEKLQGVEGVVILTLGEYSSL